MDFLFENKLRLKLKIHITIFFLFPTMMRVVTDSETKSQCYQTMTTVIVTCWMLLIAATSSRIFPLIAERVSRAINHLVSG